MLKHTHGFYERESENKKHIDIANIAKQIYKKSESLQQFNELITVEFAKNKKVNIIFESDMTVCEYVSKKPVLVFHISPCTYLVPNKAVSRVDERYTLGTKDHRDQYRMLLNDGKTCADCRHVEKCVSMYGQKEDATKCQFGGNKFHQK